MFEPGSVTPAQLRHIGDHFAGMVMIVLNQCGPMTPEQKRGLREAAEIWYAASQSAQDG